MVKIAWKKDEFGWLHASNVTTVDVRICNMRGQSIRYSGKTTPCWVVRINGYDVVAVFTKADAVREAERVIEIAEKTKGAES